MYLKRLTLANFKCYRQEISKEINTNKPSQVQYQQFEFSAGLNYLVGNNNSGKTTVLEAIDFLRNGVPARGADETTEALRSKEPNTRLSEEVEQQEGRDEHGSPNEHLEQDTKPNSKETHNPNQPKEYFVEGVFADVSTEIDSLDETNARKFKKIVHNDEITVRRYFGENDKVKEIQYKNPDGDFSNITGIDAPFKSLFDPTLIKSTTTPDDALDFGTTKTLGKLTSAAQGRFKESEQWNALTNAFLQAFEDKDEGYVSYLNDLKEEINRQVREQYGNIAISFDFKIPEPSALIKSGIITVDDGFLESDLSSKGNGLQRAVALSLLQIYAKTTRRKASEKKTIKAIGQKTTGSTTQTSISSQEQKPNPTPLFLCLDEPEIWLHPTAQAKLAHALSDIAANEQMWIPTHSPYILKAFRGQTQDDPESTAVDHHSKLYIFHDFNSKEAKQGKRIVSNDKLGTLHEGEPSLGEISFEAFQIPTPEFHAELFGKIQALMDANWPSELNKKIKNLPYKNEIQPPLTEHKRFNSQSLTAKNTPCPISKEYLPVYIRNCIDHPEAIEKKDEALQRALDGEPKFAECLEELKQANNSYDDDMLFKSIQIMLYIYEHEKNSSASRLE